MNIVLLFLRFIIISVATAISIYIRTGRLTSLDGGGIFSAGVNRRESIFDRGRAVNRRKKALASCARFLSQKHNTYIIKNKFISLSYDSANETMVCWDQSGSGKILYIEWGKQKAYDLYAFSSMFDEVFDYICINFNKNTNYNYIARIAKNYFTVEETLPAQLPENADNAKYVLKASDNSIINTEAPSMVDINSANEKEISKLPGINIILAKKIVKYRDAHGGFKTTTEFFNIAKLKSHFEDQIRDLIYLGQNNGNLNRQNTSQGRIIDF